MIRLLVLVTMTVLVTMPVLGEPIPFATWTEYTHDVGPLPAKPKPRSGHGWWAPSDTCNKRVYLDNDADRRWRALDPRPRRLGRVVVSRRYRRWVEDRVDFDRRFAKSHFLVPTSCRWSWHKANIRPVEVSR